MDYEFHCCDSFHDIIYFKEMSFLKQCNIYAKNIITDILRAFLHSITATSIDTTVTVCV